MSSLDKDTIPGAQKLAQFEEPKLEIVDSGDPQTTRPAIIRGKRVRIIVDHSEDFGDPLPLAKLIVAAPDLLEELTKTNIFLVHVVSQLVARLPSDSPIPTLLEGHIELNGAAIAKAKS